MSSAAGPRSNSPGHDAAGWLFALIAALTIGAVLSATGREHRASTLRPPADGPAPTSLPRAPAMEFAPVSADAARTANRLVPIVTRGFVAPRPFFYAGGGDDRARARDCLAAAMLYEAGDDTRGQQAVGQVVINRARHPAFPKTICGVVFEGAERATGCQFTFTCDGALGRRYPPAAWSRAQTNADRMLSGTTYAPVGLATHYHTDWVRPYWSDSLEKIAVEGTHLFFRWPGYWGTAAAYRGLVSGQDLPVTRLAALSPLHAAIAAAALPVDAVIHAELGEAVASEGAPEPAGRDNFLALLDRRAAPENFVATALRICAERPYCKFMGWTNPLLKPSSDAMSDVQRNAMSFSYLRDDKTGFEKALWNCAEFQRDDTRQCMKR